MRPIHLFQQELPACEGRKRAVSCVFLIYWEGEIKGIGTFSISDAISYRVDHKA
jgi:hypothetical protein